MGRRSESEAPHWRPRGLPFYAADDTRLHPAILAGCMVSKGLTGGGSWFAPVIPGREANLESRPAPNPSYPRRRVSSTPRPIGSIAAVSGILTARSSRAMTAVNIPAACRQALAAPANGEAAFIGPVFKPHEGSPN